MSDLLARLRITADAKDVVREAGAAERAVGRLQPAGRQAKAGLDQAAAGAGAFERSAGGARGQALLLASALGGFSLRAFAGDISEAAFKVQGFNTGLGAVAGGARGAAEQQGFLRTESQRLGLVVQDQVASFMNLAGATNGTALAGQATQDIWLGLVEAGTALNRSSEQQQRAMEAISQMASKGVISMEELRGQLSEAIPGAMQIAARAMGVTTAELGKMVGEGDVLATDFLPKFAAQLRREFGPALNEAMNSPLGQARRELAQTKTAIFDLQSAAGAEFLSAATAGVRAFNAELADADTLAAARQLGAALGEGASLAAQGAAALADNIELVATAGQILAGLALGNWLQGLATKTAASVIAMGGLRAAMGGLVSFMGGPLGIAVAAGIVGWEYFASAERKAAQATQDLADTKANALSAMQSALDFTERYGVANDALKAAIDGVASGQAAATDQTEDSVGATDRATDAARRRVEVERALTVELLRKAAADAMSRGREAQDAARKLATKSTIGGALAAMGTGDIAFGQQVQAQSESEKKAVQTYGLATQSFNAAKQLHEQANALAAADLTAARAAGVLQDTHQRAAAAITEANAGVSDSHKGRAKASAEVREAEQRLARARELTDKIGLDTRLLADRAEAMGLGAAAVEDLRVKEAGLQALQQLGVTTLTALTGKQREAAAALVAAAEANERQAIATEKAERVAGAVKDLDRRIAAEKARTAAVTGGVRAMLDFAKAEAVRQEVERAGENLTKDQIEQIERKVELLLQVQAANDNAEALKAQREELELLSLTNEEREIEIRARQVALRLQRENNRLTDEEAKVRARIIAMQDVKTEERARELGELKEDLKRTFIESGELGFDQVGDYALKKLREAIYKAFLEKPIDIILNATVQGLGGLTGAGGQGGGLLGSVLSKIPGVGLLASALGPAMIGTSIGQSLGLGTGNAKTDTLIGLGGGALGVGVANSMLGGYLGAGIANTALGMGASTALAGSMGAMLSSAAVLGPLGAIAGLAIGSLFKDDKRPYARSDFGVVNGQFAVTGGQELDKGPLDKTGQAAEQIVQSLNAAAALFKLDLTKLSGNMGSVGYVEGKNTGALGQGWFGGGGGGFSGAEFTGSKDPEKLAAEIVKSTIIKAINAGAADLSEAEKNVVLQATNLEEAANKIAAGRSIAQSVEDAMLQFTNPALFERRQALAAIEESYEALKAQAQELVTAGLVSGDVLAKIDQLKQLQVDDALRRLGQAADEAATKLKQGDDFKAELNEAYLKIVDPAAYQQARGAREIAAAIEEMRARASAMIAHGVLGPEVMGQLDALQQLQLADLARQVAETADVFAQGRKTIKSWLEGLSGSVYAELSPAAAKAQAQSDYSRQLAKAQGGDAEAYNSITSYADRLLAADRAATDSAQDRLGLANRVRAELEALTQAQGRSGAEAALAEQMKLFGVPLNKLVLTSEATAAANDDMITAMTPSLAVSLANVPMLASAYGEVTTAQTDRVVAAIEGLRSDLLAVLGKLPAGDAGGAAALAAQVIAQGFDGLSNVLQTIPAGMADMARDNRVTQAYLRRVS